MWEIQLTKSPGSWNVPDHRLSLGPERVLLGSSPGLNQSEKCQISFLDLLGPRVRVRARPRLRLGFSAHHRPPGRTQTCIHLVPLVTGQMCCGLPVRPWLNKLSGAENGLCSLMDLTSSKYAPEKGLAIVLSAVTPDVTAADGCLSYDRQKPREGTLVARETQQGTGGTWVPDTHIVKLSSSSCVLLSSE